MFNAKNIITLEKINIYLICLIPLFLITGPFLSNLLVVIIVINFIFLIFCKKEFIYFFHPLAIFLYLWSFYLILRSLLSEMPLLSLESSLFYWRYIIFALAIWYSLESYPKVTKYFFYILSFAFYLLIFFGFLEYYTGTTIYGLKTNFGDGYRISSLFGEELILGSYMTRLFPIFFGLALLIKNKSNIIIFFALITFILVDILIYLSGERVAFFYLLLTTIIFLIFLNKWKILRLFTFLMSIIIILFFLKFDEASKLRIIDKTIYQLSQGNKINVFSVQHEIIYKSSYKIFLDYPIFGIGPKLFREKCKEEKYKIIDERSLSDQGCQTSPHNSYVQVLTELGMVGIIFLLGIFFFVCSFFIKHFWSKLFFKKSKITDFQVCFLTAALITLWPLAPTGNFFGSYINIFYFLPIGFLMYSFKNKI